jgi:hypothetical protein
MRPLSKTTVTLFFVKLIAMYALLIVLWLWAGGPYARLLCATGDTVFRSFGGEGRVDFKIVDPPPRNAKALDFVIRLENIRTRATGTFELERNTRNMGYLPTAFTAALVLATPVSWKRRAWALLWSMLLISAFVGLQLAIHLLLAFSDANALNQFAFAPWVKGLIGVALKVVVLSPVTAYIAPVFIWLLVTFRRDDWEALRHDPLSLPGTGAR